MQKRIDDLQNELRTVKTQIPEQLEAETLPLLVKISNLENELKSAKAQAPEQVEAAKRANLMPNAKLSA